MPAEALSLDPVAVEPEALAPTSIRVTRPEGAAGIGIDGEAGALALADLGDVGLVDADLELHRAEILGDGEQDRRLEGGGDGLAGIDLAREHHAGDRRIDGRLGEIGLRRGELGPRLRDLRLGRATPACARRFSARAASSSVSDGTRPPETRNTSSCRARLARACAAEASAVATWAWAEARPACAWTIVS